MSSGMSSMQMLIVGISSHSKVLGRRQLVCQKSSKVTWPQYLHMYSRRTEGELHFPGRAQRQAGVSGGFNCAENFGIWKNGGVSESRQNKYSLCNKLAFQVTEGPGE